MSETPAWLTGGDSNANGGGDNFEMTTAVNVTQPAGGSTTTGASTTSAGAGASTSAEDEEKLPGVILTMRLANMGVSIALCVVSILTIIGNFTDPSVFVLAIYATCGGILICCLETQLKFLRVIIAVNFGFLFNSVWRFLFYMLLGSVCWSYGSLFGKIVAGCICGCAIFNTYVLCRYPAYRRIREKIAEEEDKRIEARISKEVKRQAVRQMTSPS